MLNKTNFISKELLLDENLVMNFLKIIKITILFIKRQSILLALLNKINRLSRQIVEPKKKTNPTINFTCEKPKFHTPEL